MRRSWILAALLASGSLSGSLSGCLSALDKHGDTLRSRASFDLQCPREGLQVTEIDKLTAGVEGCSQRATYVYNNGTWVLNSPGTEQPGSGVLTQPPPPPPRTPPPPPPSH